MFFGKRTLFLLVAAAVAIKIFSLSPLAVERYYSNGIYPVIAGVQRALSGWVPFSVGDILYAVVIIWLIRQLVRFFGRIRNKKMDKGYLKNAALNLTACFLLVYVAFNFLWGLNYNRVGMDQQLKLDIFKYTNEDLTTVTEQLALRLNAFQPSSEHTRKGLKRKKHLFEGAVLAFSELSQKNSLFAYSFPSVKPSIYSYLGNYLGFTGYYNPFTGEAQVNTTIPPFVRPFTACHEIGHQLGYAKESEANFAGYLSASSSTDTAFLYSVYFDMYAYAGRYLYLTDSIALKRINGQLSEGVKNDIRELRSFFRKYDTPIGTAIDDLYARYLVANEQPSGRMSYNEVVGMLIAYYKKYGKL